MTLELNVTNRGKNIASILIFFTRELIYKLFQINIPIKTSIDLIAKETREMPQSRLSGPILNFNDHKRASGTNRKNEQ